jgi:hypothetical protein
MLQLHNDSQHIELICDTQHNKTFIMLIAIMMSATLKFAKVFLTKTPATVAGAVLSMAIFDNQTNLICEISPKVAEASKAAIAQ